MVVDLSHWDPASSYTSVKNAGFFGCIYKATEGSSYSDSTYVQQQQAAKSVGMKWGAYHFADSSNVNAQIDNFMKFACPDPDELFCLDWEDNGGNVMSKANAQTWITEVEKQLHRPGQCVIYSGNTAKEALGSTKDSFFGARRLWLCQYSSSPTWQASWDTFWLWQFTDGQSGPTPHTVSGVGPCDINSYDQSSDQLIAEWATGKREPTPAPPPVVAEVNVLVAAPPGVPVKVRQIALSQSVTPRQIRRIKEAIDAVDSSKA